MSNTMTFPETVDDFMELFKIVDTEKVYSNGIEYVPVFRMRQWFEHEKDDKYRWHDLRKNPEDLPENGYYDTWSYWHEAYQNNRAFYDADKKRWLFHPDNNTGKPWIEGLSIIAWREIEPFKEE